MSNTKKTLADFLADVVMTGYYLAEPVSVHEPTLHDAEMKCLKIIGSFGPIEMSRLATLLHATKPRVTQLVQSLEQHHFVARLPGRDARVSRIAVTVDGDRVIRDIRKKYDDLAESIENKIGKKKAKDLANLLAEITPLHNSVD